MGHDRILEEDAMVEGHHSSDGLPGSVLSWFGDWGGILLSPEREVGHDCFNHFGLHFVSGSREHIRIRGGIERWFFLISTRQQKTSKAVFPVS